MKVKPGALARLHKQLAAKSIAAGRSYTEIGKLAEVHPSQVSRICRGKFRTLSHNVVQICNVLGIRVTGVPRPTPLKPIATQLSASVLAMWKGTPEDAARITRLLNQLKELRDTAAQ